LCLSGFDSKSSNFLSFYSFIIMLSSLENL
jgi:hypothetical protein